MEELPASPPLSQEHSLLFPLLLRAHPMTTSHTRTQDWGEGNAKCFATSNFLWGKEKMSLVVVSNLFSVLGRVLFLFQFNLTNIEHTKGSMYDKLVT